MMVTAGTVAHRHDSHSAKGSRERKIICKGKQANSNQQIELIDQIK